MLLTILLAIYDHIGLHSKLGNLLPNAFERELTSEKPISLSEMT